MQRILLLLIFSVLNLGLAAQNSIDGYFTQGADEYEWVILYQLKGANQLYIENTDVIEGKFSFMLPAESEKGMYRISYGTNRSNFVDFLFDHEDVKFSFDPSKAGKTIAFEASNNNKLYTNYLRKSEASKVLIDSLQVTYLSESDEAKKALISDLYTESLDYYVQQQHMYESKSQGLIANSFIKAERKFYRNEIIPTAQEYLNSEKEHFFDYVDFNDPILFNATLLSAKAVDYVFYLNRSSDSQVQTALYKNAVNYVMDKVGNNGLVKSELLTVLMYSFAQIENAELMNYCIDEHYENLPDNYKNPEIVEQLRASVALAIGSKAPNFTWEVNGEMNSLHEIDKAETYVLVFWSTGCSHCLVEVPMLYDYLKDNPDVHVIAVALEEDTVGFNKHTTKFQQFTNVLGLRKWENPIGQKYQITATPTYFVLDKDKKIIAKPEYFRDVKTFFEAK